MKRSTCLPGSSIAGLILLCWISTATASLPGDEHWDKQFGPPGANGQIFSITTCRNRIYIGGAFTAAGNAKANFIAAFDGTNWSALGSGPSAGVLEVAGLGSDGTNVYVGGVFTNIDNSGAVDNAIWNGTNFSPWPSGTFGGVGAVFKRQGTNLYVGGNLTTAGAVTLNGIGRWDGANWHSLGTGVSGCTGQFCQAVVDALEFQGSDVYAGGNFVTAGGVTASYIARYDGSAWHPVGSTINGQVSALVFFGGYLYAGGAFTNSGAGIMNIARWDGATWSALPGGGANRQVSSLATDGTNLYVGGQFSQIGGIPALAVASFSGSTWSPLGAGIFGVQGFGGQVFSMVLQSNQLYAAGNFEAAGNVGAAFVARWDGANWWSLGSPASEGLPPDAITRVNSMLPVQNSIFLPSGLYVGGLFSEAGDVIVNGLGRWDGTAWNSVGGGVTGINGTIISVRAMVTDGAYLYAGGYFTNAGGNAASNIAYWNSNNWSPMGPGVDYIINAMAIDNANYIYVGGNFTNAGGIYSRGFAVSAYGSWYNFGNVEGTNGAVNSIVYDGGTKVYLGGSFFSAGSVLATNIAYFDNSDFSWHALGNGLNAKANVVAYGNGLLYAGGSFTRAGNVIANHVAQWDGTNWSAMGSGITGGSSIIVNSLVVSGTNVYATGNFTNAGGVSATNIAKWNGSTWSALGSGLDITKAGFVQAAVGNDLYVGGNFSLAGDKPALFFARWNDQSNFYPAPHPMLTRPTWLTNRQFQFRLAGTSGESYILQASTNFSAWTPMLTNTTPLYDFTDTNASKSPARFYRAVLGP